MWVCLRTVKNLVIKGQVHHYKPGEWVNVGRQLAREWIAAGDAYDFDQTGKTGDKTTGIVLFGNAPGDWLDRLHSAMSVTVVSGDMPDVPFAETLLYRPEFELRLDLMLTGFKLLQRWQVAIPLWNYETLAAQVGTEEERERTKAVIRDLRVPLRDTRLVFMRRCAQTRELTNVWREELTNSTDERLAFLRALYRIKPVICDLPASWTGNVRA